MDKDSEEITIVFSSKRQIKLNRDSFITSIILATIAFYLCFFTFEFFENTQNHTSDNLIVSLFIAVVFGISNYVDGD